MNTKIFRKIVVGSGYSKQADGADEDYVVINDTETIEKDDMDFVVVTAGGM